MASNLESQSLDPNSAAFLNEAAASKFDFYEISTKATSDVRLRTAVSNTTTLKSGDRQRALMLLPDSDALRELAGQIKQHTLDNLDYYIEQLKAAVEANGGHVHFAETGEDARRIITELAMKTQSKRVIKSKSMVTEEISLLHHLENAGMDVVETDLGEFIVQISHDKPSHIVAPDYP